MKKSFIFYAIAFSVLASGVTFANIHTSFKNKSLPVIQAFDQGQRNTVSNIYFWQENYGPCYYDIGTTGTTEGTFWPRGYNFNYVFGGGFWLVLAQGRIHKSLVAYDPNSGRSWFQPGSADSAVAFAKENGRFPGSSDAAYDTKYTIYFSTQYDQHTGKPLNPSSGLPPWPIWDTDPDSTHIVRHGHYFGNYVDDTTLRDTSHYHVKYYNVYDTTYDTVTKKTTIDSTVVQKGGPAFVSDEDMFTICNDVDSTQFSSPSYTGYPHIESQRTIYSWGSSANQNYIFVAYKIVNRDTVILDSCWLAPAVDFDIGLATLNDETYYKKDTTLNFAYGWSDKQSSATGANYGVPPEHVSDGVAAYPGVEGWDFLQSPTVYKSGDDIVDSNGNDTHRPISDSVVLIGSIKPGVYPTSQQLGLVTFRRWNINNDPKNDETRWTFMTGGEKDTSPNGMEWADYRMLMATGPFKLLPGQTAQVVYGLMIARDSANGDNILDSSISDCIALCHRAQQVYDSNFRVPSPPVEPTFRTVLPLCNGVFVTWDSASEYTFDPLGSGLDFLGYNLYRGRQDLIGNNGTTLYDQYKNPFGYQLVHTWSLSQLDSLTFKNIENNQPPHSAAASVQSTFAQTYIAPYMDSLTNHHSFYDFGDLQNNGVISTQEQLINDVNYFYWLAAFNQGKPSVGVPSQQTTGKIGQSKIEVHPVSSYAGQNSNFEILSHQGQLGGISNFQWNVQNQQIVNQLLAGDTLVITFQDTLYDWTDAYITYGLHMNVFDKDSTRHINVTYPYVGAAFPQFIAEPDPAVSSFYYANNVTNKADSLIAGVLNNVTDCVFEPQSLPLTDTSFAPNQYLLQAVSHSFNTDFYQISQWRAIIDSINPITDSTSKHYTINGVVDTVINDIVAVPIDTVNGVITYGAVLDTVWSKPGYFDVYYNLDTDVIDPKTDHPILNMNRAFGIMQTSNNANVPIYFNSFNTSFDSAANIGQYDYLVQFVGPVQDTTITVNKISYNVPYLNVQVTGEQLYHVVGSNGQDSLVKIVFPLSPAYTSPIQAGQWFMYPYFWVLSQNVNSDSTLTLRRKEHGGEPSNTYLNKYFLTAQNDTNTLAFTNLLHVGGKEIYLDSVFRANEFTERVEQDTGVLVGANQSTTYDFKGINMHPATHDFAAGDIIRISYKGGMLGLPTPGASITTYFTPSVPQGGTTSDSSAVSSSELANVHVWPNPYVIGNSVNPDAPGLQTPPLGNNLTFNHLPPQCTIRIFNIVGDLIRTINHTTGSEEHWDLTNDGGQLSGSQLLVAELQTPNGSKAMVDIAIIAYGR